MSKSFFCAFFVVLPDYDETAKSSNMNKESQLHSEHAHNDDKKRLNKKRNLKLDWIYARERAEEQGKDDLKKTNEILAISRKKAIFLQFGTFSQAKIALLKC